MAPQPWNLGPGRADFTSLGNLGSTFFNAFDKAKERQTLANLGQQIQAGDYEGASRSAFAAGDAGTGLGLLKLRQAEKDRDAERQFLNSLGGGGAAQPSAAPVALGNPNEIETRFVNTVKGAGLTNPIGLGAVAAYGKAESGFSPQNVNRTWSDPSESGQPGTAGGIMSWRADRLANLQAFARQRGEAQPSVETQALFLAQENPQLIPALQAAKTPQEANQIMANAWRFAGYDRPGGENARRLALTQGYAQRFGGQAGPAPAIPVQVAENEADVQRLEAQQGNPAVDAPAPVQVAQAPMQPGASASDAPNIPAPGAAEAQGFAIPGTDTVVPQSLMNDPQVQRFSRLLMIAPTERARAAVKGQLDLAIKDAERRQAQNAPTEALRNYRFYRQEEQAAGRTPMSFQQFRESTAARTTIKNEGSIPAGYRAVRDAQGNVERLEPIPGSEAAKKAEEAASKDERQKAMMAQTGMSVFSALDDIDRTRASSRFPVAGGMSGVLAAIPGTGAHNVAQSLNTIRANISFERLNQMRQASPTGGALGAVSDSEQRLLSNSLAALEQSQDNKQFERNLKRVRAAFEKVVNGKVLSPDERAAEAKAREDEIRGEDAPQGSAPPKRGELVDGYRYKGGNPADPNSWVKVR